MKPTNLRVAGYLRDLAAEMIDMAHKAHLSSAAYMLELVVLELKDVVEAGKQKPKPNRAA